MTHPDRFVSPRSAGNTDALPQGPNALGLNEERLARVASLIREQGMTLEKLLDIANHKITSGNPLLSNVVFAGTEEIQRQGGDLRSYNRGVALGYHLIDQSSATGAPIMGVQSLKLAARYKHQPVTLEDRRVAADGLLTSQEALSAAFDVALAGMPEGTDRDMARFGAGIITLGAMAAAQFGGSGTEEGFVPDQH